MIKCVIWGSGEIYKKHVKNLKWDENIGKIAVCGIVSKEVFGNELDGWNILQREDLPTIDFDVLLIAAKNTYNEIQKEAALLQIPDNVICPIDIVSNLNLDWEKYLLLKKRGITIFSNNCWGGVVYHYYRLPFMSPFINMSESDVDYLKFLSNPKKYLNSELEFVKYSQANNHGYPIGRLDDTLLHFIHYSTFGEAIDKWNTRVKRIEWDNLVVMMISDNEECIKQFCELPYTYKICFTTCDIMNEAVFHVDREKYGDLPLWRIVNWMGRGVFEGFDFLEWLNMKGYLDEV